MKKQILKNNKGFVMLFAVMISSMILAIALGVAGVALKEINFSTQAKNTNEAFFAADAGIECALFNDKSTLNKFPLGGPATIITCSNTSVIPIFSANIYNFTISGLGNSGESCAKVTVDKTLSPAVTVVSKGYDVGGVSCFSSNPNRVERELKVTFVNNLPVVPSMPETPCQTACTGNVFSNTGDYNMGYKFTVNRNGKISALWTKPAQGRSYVLRLYDNSNGAILASKTIEGIYNTWTKGDIDPVAVTAGNSYVVSVRVDSGGSFMTPFNQTLISLPKTTNNIIIDAGASVFRSDALPAPSAFDRVYGLVDVTYEAD